MFCGSEGDSLMVEQRPLAPQQQQHQHHCIMDLDARNVQMPVPISAGYCASPPEAPRLHQMYPSTNGNANGAGNGVVVVVPQEEPNPSSTHASPTETTKAEKIVRYKECQRNHAANIGGHALDGCGEFMSSGEDALKCAACGCHRNFHRREVEGEQPCDCCRKDRKRGSSSGPGSPTPYYPLPHGSSAPHMLMALSSGLGESDDQDGGMIHHRGMKKRFRTKFSQDQKEKMYLFADKLGWRMQKQDEAVVQQFCNEIGVGKGVLKVWMHNNKHTLGKKP